MTKSNAKSKSSSSVRGLKQQTQVKIKFNDKVCSVSPENVTTSKQTHEHKWQIQDHFQAIDYDQDISKYSSSVWGLKAIKHRAKYKQLKPARF